VTIAPRRLMRMTWLAVLAASGCSGRLPPVSSGSPSSADSSRADRPAYGASGYAEELFAGRFPGVRIFLLPNGALSVQVRGLSTIHGSAQPLYVIDGLPVEAEEALLFINPAEIRRIEVLKDVGATAVYGVRGGNGVVLITTAALDRQ
jgi:TonB-dependent starch-binding outer membrane protein SusC